MKKKRGTPRRKPARKVSTALERRAPRSGQLVTERGKFPTPPMITPFAPPLTLPPDPMMSAQFVGTLNLEQKQIDALRRPVDEAELDWKPVERDGPPIMPYLSHNGYRDRLDAAFGLGGWGMVPVGQPKKEGEKFIYVPYAMVIGGVPRIYTWGEQQIHTMTYGDALEGCKSNAIVRCGKELGIARELWDRKHVADLMKRRGTITADGQTRGSSPRAGYNDKDAQPITNPQRQRLVMIVKNSGRTEFEVLRFLKEMFSADGTKDIKRGDYEAICRAVEAPGDLPRPPLSAREPGEEG